MRRQAVHESQVPQLTRREQYLQRQDLDKETPDSLSNGYQIGTLKAPLHRTDLRPKRLKESIRIKQKAYALSSPKLTTMTG
jgi:hypothetical protein